MKKRTSWTECKNVWPELVDGAIGGDASRSDRCRERVSSINPLWSRWYDNEKQVGIRAAEGLQRTLREGAVVALDAKAVGVRGDVCKNTLVRETATATYSSYGRDVLLQAVLFWLQDLIDDFPNRLSGSFIAHFEFSLDLPSETHAEVRIVDVCTIAESLRGQLARPGYVTTALGSAQI